MSVALAASLQFIRAEGFVFSHVADEGLIAKACAGDLLRYRDRGNSAQSVLSYLCEDAPHERWVDSQNVGIGIDSLNELILIYDSWDKNGKTESTLDSQESKLTQPYTKCIILLIVCAFVPRQGRD